MRTRAIIIKKQTTNEYDELVTCYTQDFGKLTAVAKSILKGSSMQAMHLDNLNLAEFELISGKSLPIIAAAQSERSFRNIKSSLPLLAVAQFFADVVDKMVFDLQKDEELWDFMFGVLDKLDSKVRPESALSFLRQQQFYMLKVMGYDSDTQFEHIAGQKLKSLDFIHSVLK